MGLSVFFVAILFDLLPALLPVSMFGLLAYYPLARTRRFRYVTSEQPLVRLPTNIPDEHGFAETLARSRRAAISMRLPMFANSSFARLLARWQGDELEISVRGWPPFLMTFLSIALLIALANVRSGFDHGFGFLIPSLGLPLLGFGFVYQLRNPAEVVVRGVLYLVAPSPAVEARVVGREGLLESLEPLSPFEMGTPSFFNTRLGSAVLGALVLPGVPMFGALAWFIFDDVRSSDSAAGIVFGSLFALVCVLLALVSLLAAVAAFLQCFTGRPRSIWPHSTRMR